MAINPYAHAQRGQLYLSRVCVCACACTYACDSKVQRFYCIGAEGIAIHTGYTIYDNNLLI